MESSGEQNESDWPRIEAVVFDMDGLMFNTEDLYDEVGDRMLRRRGHRWTQELKLKMMGLPGPQAWEVMRREFGLTDPVEVLQAECDREFVELLPVEIRMMPGLETVLARVERLGLPKAIATSSHREFARTALGCFDLESRFEFVLTAADVPRESPTPTFTWKRAPV